MRLSQTDRERLDELVRWRGGVRVDGTAIALTTSELVRELIDAAYLAMQSPTPASRFPPRGRS